MVRTDNASVLTYKVFKAALFLLGMNHKLSEVGCPWQNGRIERFWGTLKREVVRNVGLLDFFGQTPAQVWNAQVAMNPKPTVKSKVKSKAKSKQRSKANEPP